MIVLRILGTIILAANLLLESLLFYILVKDKNQENEENALGKIYLILNMACLIFVIVLMWVL